MDEKRVALVTGAGGGIGRAIAVKLAKDGYTVVVHYGHSDTAAKETEELCKQEGANTLLLQADLTSAEQIDAMFDAIADRCGRLDVLVNNAGITKDNLILRMKQKEFDDVIDANLFGPFYCMKRASKMMLRKKYGRIINISSVVGLRGNPGQVNYAAAKAGIIGMTKSLAKELATKGITVNAIAPGMIETKMTQELGQEAREALLASIPCGQIGRGEDVAHAVSFFAAPESGYVTGQVLAVDGGMAV